MSAAAARNKTAQTLCSKYTFKATKKQPTSFIPRYTLIFLKVEVTFFDSTRSRIAVF